MPAHPIKLTPQAAWEDENLLTTPLLALYLDAFGTEALSWAPETAVLEVRDEFGAKMPLASLDRLMAGCHLLTNDDFWRLPSVFNDLCLVFAGNAASPGTWVPADAAECAWGITEAYLIDPPDDPEPFSDDVRKFLGMVLDEEGVVHPPDVLRLALRDNDYNSSVEAWSDDEEIYPGIQQVQSEKSEAIVRYLKERLALLLSQLQSLPLRNGDISQLFARH